MGEFRHRELAEGIARVTFPLPLGIDHVHCYLLRGADGWTLVDTGLGLPDAEARWTPILAALDGPVVRIVITHGHPDHVGDAAAVAELTGAHVLQGRIDHARCVEVWEDPEWPQHTAEHLLAHGMPAELVRAGRAQSELVARMIHLPQMPELLDAGDTVDGWRVEYLPGHADGHIALLRNGTMIAGDVLLLGITPVVGVYPGGRPDPLGDYLESLATVAALAPAVAFAGHGAPIGDPAGRAEEIAEHHRVRANLAQAALAGGAENAYDVSVALFGELSPEQRRFAVAESLAHLEHLVSAERAVRSGSSFALG